jgi:hypothetical protein
LKSSPDTGRARTRLWEEKEFCRKARSWREKGNTCVNKMRIYYINYICVCSKQESEENLKINIHMAGLEGEKSEELQEE